MTVWTKPLLKERYVTAGDAGTFNKYLFSQNLKLCARCKEILPFSDFTSRGNRYVVSKCRKCVSEYYYERADEIREKNRERQFGTAGIYDELLDTFGAQCMICSTTEPEGTGKANKQFCIDHDEESGQIRGLLCTQCNVGIGVFKHDTDRLWKAIAYLSRPEGYWEP